jgi:multidrug efflux pump subunit AcrA (membrane-fusion protein)
MAEENEEIELAEIESDQIADEADQPGTLTRNIVIAVIVILLLVGGGLFYYLRSTKPATAEADTKEEIVVSVRVATAEKDSISSEISAPGTVVPAEQSTVSSTISAQIIQMRLLKNSVVQKGEVIAVLASQDLRAQRDEAQSALNEAKLNLETLEQVTIPQTNLQTEKDTSDAKANMDNARSTYERRVDLYKKGGLSLKELEASQLALTNAENAYRLIVQNSKLNKNAVNPNARAIAQAKIRQAQDRLNAIQVQANMAEIKAPISGIVTDQFQFEGEFASSGGKLLTIGTLSEVIVKAQFADSVAATLRNGDAVSVFPPGAPDDKLTGRVTLISRSGDSQSRTVEVWARFGNPRGSLVLGGAVQFVVTNKTADDVVVVPAAAVTLDASNADEGVVMVVGADSVAHETKVKTGIRWGDKIEIVEGLDGGETVVTEGHYSLPDGTKVEVAEEPAAGEEKE